MLLSSLFDDPYSGLVEVLARFFPLILWWTVRQLLVEQICFSLGFIGFSSFLCHTDIMR
jgi:hypothetical protein